MVDKQMYAHMHVLHYNSKVQVIAGRIWVFLDALVSSPLINVLIRLIGPTPDVRWRRVYISTIKPSKIGVIAL